MTPVGHASVSCLAGIAMPRRSIAILVAAGLWPDVDFVLLWMDNFDAFHRVITHNVFFVIGTAIIAALVLPRKRLMTFQLVLIGGGLHLLMDSLLDSNPGNGVGVAFLWPVVINCLKCGHRRETRIL